MSDPVSSADRLERALASLGAEHEPPLGWQARVLAQVAQVDGRRRWWGRASSGWWRLVLPALAACAAVVLLRAPGPTRGASVLTVDRVADPKVMRGASSDVMVGGHVFVRLRSRVAYRAIWVYRDDLGPVAGCPGMPCRDGRRELTMDLALDRSGAYVVVGLAADRPLPPSRGLLDADLSLASEAGVLVGRETIRVR